MIRMEAKAKAKAMADGVGAVKVMLARANMPVKENGVTKSNLGSTSHHLRVMVKAIGKAVFSLGHGARHGDVSSTARSRSSERKGCSTTSRRMGSVVSLGARSAAKLAVSFQN